MLIADGDVSARERLRQGLRAAKLDVIGEAEGGDGLPERLAEVRPDALIVASGLLPAGEDVGPIAGGRWNGPILVLTHDGDTDADTAVAQRERIARSGAFATLPQSVSGADAAAAVHLAVQRFRELQGCQESLDKLQNRLADRIVIERAKGLLMQGEGLSEEEAFKRIHFDARRQNRTMRSVAEEVLARHATPPPTPSGAGVEAQMPPANGVGGVTSAAGAMNVAGA